MGSPHWVVSTTTNPANLHACLNTGDGGQHSPTFDATVFWITQETLNKFDANGDLLNPEEDHDNWWYKTTLQQWALLVDPFWQEDVNEGYGNQPVIFMAIDCPLDGKTAIIRFL